MRHLLTFIMLSLCFTAKAQTISGIVTDKTTGMRLTGAWVTSTNGSAISNLQGEYSISVKKLADSIKVKMPGYKLCVRAINPAAEVYLKIELEPRVIELTEVSITGKRNRIKDSLNTRRLFAKDFNSAPPKFSDIFEIAPGTGPLDVAGITIHPSQLVALLTYKHSRAYKFKKVLIRDEQLKYVESRFTTELVSKLTNLKSDSLEDFIDQYRPPIAQVKKMTDYDMVEYIKGSALKFRESK